MAAGYILVDSRRLQRSKSIKQLVCHRGTLTRTFTIEARDTPGGGRGSVVVAAGDDRRDVRSGSAAPLTLSSSEEWERSIAMNHMQHSFKNVALNEVKVSLSPAAVIGFQIYLFFFLKKVHNKSMCLYVCEMISCG